jgi:hypothetical protein
MICKAFQIWVWQFQKCFYLFLHLLNFIFDSPKNFKNILYSQTWVPNDFELRRDRPYKKIIFLKILAFHFLKFSQFMRILEILLHVDTIWCQHAVPAKWSSACPYHSLPLVSNVLHSTQFAMTNIILICQTLSVSHCVEISQNVHSDTI